MVPANTAGIGGPLLSAGQHAAPHGPSCDGCHSVDYDIQTKTVTEWNVGCERCHGPGSEHVAHPTCGNILNPARMDSVRAERYLHPVPFSGAALDESDQGQVLRLAGRLQGRDEI